MSKVQEAIGEIGAALAEMAPKHEGLRDYASLDLTQETRTAVNAAIEQYDIRKALLDQSMYELMALVGNGYPELVVPDVSLSAFADLQANAETILAALGVFKSNPATNLGLAGDTPIPL